jgi:poly-gamma-glutamate synthesis protein (capsule biosynthesis protein)
MNHPRRALAGAAALWLIFFAILGVRSAPRPVSIALMGDVMLGRGVARALSTSGWDNAFAAVRSQYREADLVLANLESPFSTQGPPAGGNDLRWLAAPLKARQALQSGGFDLLSLANNHSLDGGEAGAELTAGVLRQVGITGMPRAGPAVFKDVNGLRLGFLAFDDVSAPIDLADSTAKVRIAKERCDLLVVSIHWGQEFSSEPSERQELLASELVKAGAGIIWGHHPHVLQRLEWLEREKDRPALVAYSLGNTLFDQLYPQTAREGAILLVTADRLGVQSVRVLPVAIDPLKGRVSPADGVERAQISRVLGIGQ